MINYSILIKNAFWEDLKQRLSSAQQRVYVQFMTFEGDSVGLELAKKLIQAKRRGIEVKVIIDCFIDFYISDTFYTKKKVADEVKATKKMVDDMRNAGIELVKTRPAGIWNLLWLHRNHKKMVIVDDTSYIGGINISDHNFEWHDFMVRFNDPKTANILVEDFNDTFQGVEADRVFNHSEVTIVTNRYLRETFYEFISSAKREVIISSPYVIDVHLLKTLKKVDNGIKIKLLVPQKNNLGVFNMISHYIFNNLKKNAEIEMYSRFSHAKFVIVDKEKVLFGSSNFSLESFLCKQEIGVSVDNPLFAQQFYKQLYIDQAEFLEHYAPRNNVFKRYFGMVFSYALLFSLNAYVKSSQYFVRPLAD